MSRARWVRGPRCRGTVRIAVIRGDAPRNWLALFREEPLKVHDAVRVLWAASSLLGSNQALHAKDLHALAADSHRGGVFRESLEVFIVPDRTEHIEVTEGRAQQLMPTRRQVRASGAKVWMRAEDSVEFLQRLEQARDVLAG